MKVRKRLILPMVVLQLVAIVSPLLAAQPVQAAAANMGQATFYYKLSSSPSDTTDTYKNLDDAFNVSMGRADSEGDEASSAEGAALKNTSVVLTGGAFNAAPLKLDYNSSTLNSNGVPYTVKYNCYINNGQPVVSGDGSGPTQEHWLIDLNIYVKKVKSSLSDANSLQAVEAIRSITEYSAFSTGNPTTQEASVNDSGNYEGVNQSDLQNVKLPGGGASQCLPTNYLNNRPNGWSAIAASSAAPPSGTLSGSTAGSTGGTGSTSATSGTNIDNACEGDQSAGALGWILCPIIDIADTAIDDIINSVIVPSLTVCPLAEPTQSVSDTNCSATSNSADYQIWQNFRNLADVVFIIAFLVVIFANVLQFNIETYTIKKMLPRLVAAVILVQFSYIISAVIIDVGNVLGAGVEGIVTVSASGASNVNSIAGSGGQLSPIETGISVALAGGLIAVIGIPALMGIALAGIIGAIGVLVTLVTRKLIIILLAVTSPIAFACWILPNTERVFKLWLQNFIKISLMFPVIVLILSLANVGSAAVANTSNGLENVMGALLPIIAFFMIPMTFKWAGQAMNFASGQISGITKKAQGGAVNRLNNSRPMQAWQQRRTDKKNERLARWATEGTGEGEEMPKVFGSRKLGQARQGAVSRWATGSLTGRGEYVAKQRQALAHQAEEARQKLYAGTSMDELAKIVSNDDTSLYDRVAIAKMAAKLGGYDDERFQDALWKGVGLDKDPNNTAKLAQFQKLVEEVKSTNYGGIKKDSILMQTFDAKKGDRIAEDGAIEMGYDSAVGLSSKAGDRILNQTGTGLKTLNNSRINAATVKEILQKVDAGEVTLEADVVSSLRAADAAGQGMAGKKMISNAVKVAAAQSQLRTKWHGEASEVLGDLKTYSGDVGGGNQDQGSIGVVDSTNPAAGADDTAEEGLGTS